MRGELLEGNPGKRATMAQAGRILCVSETIYPEGSRHSVSMVYSGFCEGGVLKPTPEKSRAGGDLVDIGRMRGEGFEIARANSGTWPHPG